MLLLAINMPERNSADTYSILTQNDQNIAETDFKETLKTIEKINKSSNSLDLNPGEFENTLLRLAKKNDHEAMRHFFEAYYSYQVRVSSKDTNPDELRRDTLWRTA
jgi:hypothetical protein